MHRETAMATAELCQLHQAAGTFIAALAAESDASWRPACVPVLSDGLRNIDTAGRKSGWWKCDVHFIPYALLFQTAARLTYSRLDPAR